MIKTNRSKINAGLSALLSDEKKVNDQVDTSLNGSHPNYSELSLISIREGRFQPRKKFDNPDELINSVRLHGILSPILVRLIKSSKNQYEIVAGERRYRAAVILELKTIPAIVKEVDDEVALAYALVENIQRQSLSALEEGAAFRRLISDFKLTHQEISERVGRSRSSITNSIRLLELESYTKEYLESGYLEMGHARALLPLTAEEQIESVNKIIDGKLNVRQTEQLVQRIKNPIIKTPMVLRAEDRILLESWRQRLLPHASQVKVKMDAHDNISVNIKCSSPEEAEKLINEIEKLKSQRTTKG